MKSLLLSSLSQKLTGVQKEKSTMMLSNINRFSLGKILPCLGSRGIPVYEFLDNVLMYRRHKNISVNLHQVYVSKTSFNLEYSTYLWDCLKMFQTKVSCDPNYPHETSSRKSIKKLSRFCITKHIQNDSQIDPTIHQKIIKNPSKFYIEVCSHF